jgi:hypothetical protein
MSPRSFMAPSAFGPEALVALGEALDSACNELCSTGDLYVVREKIAWRVIAAARFGEHDPVRLREAALTGMPVTVVGWGGRRIK